MKLFYSPGACSLASHIALIEAGLEFSTEWVDIRAKQTASGGDFRAINPKGYVPALQFEDGSVLTEGPAILQFIADLAPQSQLAPAAGLMERYRLMETLNYLSAELHKAFSPLFNPALGEEARTAQHAVLGHKLTFVAGTLEGRDYLLGSRFTVADAYLFTMLGWCNFLNYSLADWPVLQSYAARIAQRPAVQQAMRNEGLLK